MLEMENDADIACERLDILLMGKPGCGKEGQDLVCEMGKLPHSHERSA